MNKKVSAKILNWYFDMKYTDKPRIELEWRGCDGFWKVYPSSAHYSKKDKNLVVLDCGSCKVLTDWKQYKDDRNKAGFFVSVKMKNGNTARMEFKNSDWDPEFFGSLDRHPARWHIREVSFNGKPPVKQWETFTRDRFIFSVIGCCYDAASDPEFWDLVEKEE